MFIEFLLFFGTIFLGLFYWQHSQLNYWRRRGVKFLPPVPVFGNLSKLLTFKQGFPEQLETLHNDPSLKPDDALVGVYALFRPALLIRDIELIKRIMIKDFTSFTNRVVAADPVHDSLGYNNLFFVRKPQWKETRQRLSPVFTSGKVKQMYPLMVEIGLELEDQLLTIADISNSDIKQICGRFTNELIGSTAFGIRAGNLRDKHSQFFKYSKAIFEPSLRRGFDFITLLVLPRLASLVRVKLFTSETDEFFRSSVRDVMEKREKSGLHRNDLIDTLLTMKAEAKTDKDHPANNMDFLIAQAALFHTAGYETSASTMGFALYELALHQSMQERLREEIRAAFEEHIQEDGGLPYEKLQQLPYLGQVIDETLRKYPVVGFLERECTPEAGKAGYSLEPFSDFVVPAGTAMYVAPLGIQRDPRYWPEPEKFDPERFAPENRKNLNMDAYLPFGTGPRNCIGMRIGLLQTKLGLVHMLRNHRVVTTEKTPTKVIFDPYATVLSAKGGFNLKIEKLEN